MKVFKEPNVDDNWICPICKTNDNKEVVMVGIDGTREGFNIQAEIIHLSCIELIYYKDKGILAMVLDQGD